MTNEEALMLNRGDEVLFDASYGHKEPRWVAAIVVNVRTERNKSEPYTRIKLRTRGCTWITSAQNVKRP